MLSKFNNKKHRRLTALLLCVALMLGSVTSVSADISAADSETEVQSGVQNYTEETTAEAVSYGAPEAQTEVQEEAPVAEETEAPAADTQQMFFVKHFSLKKASEFPVFSEGFSLL